MTKNLLKVCLSSFVLTGGMMLVGCSTDDSIDVGDLDTTIGVGTDNFEIPASTTKDIPLGDLLDIDDSDCIFTDENGNYYFSQEGDDVDPANPRIEIITVSESTTSSHPVKITVPEIPNYDLIPDGTSLPVSGASISQEINTFNYKFGRPESVIDLETANIDGNINLVVKFNEDGSQLPAVIPTFTTLDIEFPAFMTIDITRTQPANYTLEGNKIKFVNVPTNQDVIIDATLKQIERDKSAGADVFKVEGDEILMNGDVKINAVYPDGSFAKGSADLDKLVIKGHIDITNVQITGARGNFDPAIDIEDVGDIQITDIPDFLDDDEVEIDINDPQLALTVTSDVNIDGILDGTLTSTFKDGTKQVVQVNNIIIPGADVDGQTKTTRILICRTAKELAGFNQSNGTNYDVVYPIADLSNLMKKIPESVTFKADVHADKTKVAEFTLGKDYNITTAYKFEASLALNTGSTIVYKDSFDGWNEDLNDTDLNLGDQTTIEVTGTVLNNTYLQLEFIDPKVVDVNGNVIPGVSATFDGGKATFAANGVASPLNLTIKVGEDKLKLIDGLEYRVLARSTRDGESLNTTRSSVRIMNLKLTLHGKVSIEL